MAHRYTTARGKTKKAKESVRKDAKNNAANKLMRDIVKAPTKAQERAPIDMDFINKLNADVNGMKTLEGSTKSKLFKAKQQSDSPATVSDEALTKAIRNVRVQLPSFQRCFYALCASPSESATYKHCGRCRIARYCSPECQKADWPKIHKFTCGSPESITVGSSVAIKPLEAYLSLLSPSHYPCNPPCNEIHGVATSLQSPSSSTSSPTPQTIVEVEVFDSNLIPTKVVLPATVVDVVLSGWELNIERDLAEQKIKDMEEAKKRAEQRKAMLEEEDRIYQEKKRVKEERVKVLLEKKKKEMEGSSEGVSVDWSLFETELMDTLDVEDLPEDDE